MTVKELIKALDNYNPNTLVDIAFTDSEDNTKFGNLHNVRLGLIDGRLGIWLESKEYPLTQNKDK